MTAQWHSLPAWARWPIMVALAILVLAIVQSFSDTDLLTDDRASSSMLKWSIPIMLAGLGGLFSERAGVVNIGLEGMMILGTWAGAFGAYHWGAWGGLAAGIIGGGLGGLLHAVATVTFGVDQIVSGVAINIMGPGIARYLSERVFTTYEGGSQTQSPRVEGFGDVSVPVLSDLLTTIAEKEWFWISDVAGVFEGMVTDVSWFTIMALACVPLSTFVLWRTRFGLQLRICGENPHAGESLGVKIYTHKYAAVIISGALAGMAGAFIVLELSGIYRGGQTNGRGFIGLAALIFGNWRALGIMLGSFLFAYPFGLSLVDLTDRAARALLLVIAIALAGVAAWAIRAEKKFDAAFAAVLAAIALVWYLTTDTANDWLPSTMPYAIVLIVLVFASQRLRPPRAAGLAYRRGGA
ncbi:MAG: ABC transporter permease [Acidimicrobiales bacterium]